jgi:hypothetical protein
MMKVGDTGKYGDGPQSGILREYLPTVSSRADSKVSAFSLKI